MGQGEHRRAGAGVVLMADGTSIEWAEAAWDANRVGLNTMTSRRFVDFVEPTCRDETGPSAATRGRL